MVYFTNSWPARLGQSELTRNNGIISIFSGWGPSAQYFSSLVCLNVCDQVTLGHCLSLPLKRGILQSSHYGELGLGREDSIVFTFKMGHTNYLLFWLRFACCAIFGNFDMFYPAKVLTISCIGLTTHFPAYSIYSSTTVLLSSPRIFHLHVDTSLVHSCTFCYIVRHSPLVLLYPPPCVSRVFDLTLRTRRPSV